MRKTILGITLMPATLALEVALSQTAFAAPAVLQQSDCEALAGATFDAATFAIPSGTATIDTSRFKEPAAESKTQSGTRLPATPAFCQVNGRIAPVGEAPDITFQINLPADWNGKVVQVGGGGFNGVLATGLEALRDARPGTPGPLMQGYVTAGTDSGHVAKDLPEMQAFALNPEALENFAHASYKKLHDLTVAVASRAYGERPARYYYFGGSEGGREGLTMAQRYPQDFDGIVSVVPVINWVGLQSNGTRIGALQRREGAWLTPEAVKVLGRAAVEQCDGLDGLDDGVISNTEACRARFNLDAYVCAADAAASDCLTPAQAEVAKALRTPLQYGMALSNGLTSYPGFPIGNETQSNGLGRWSAGEQPPTKPGSEAESRVWFYGNGAIRYFLAQDAAYDTDGYSISALPDRALAISALMDSTNPDLSAFEARGGKLILKENMADYAQSPYAGIAYYESVVDRLGQDEVDGFLRFYLTPGANHSGRITDAKNQASPSYVDLLESLDGWVDGGARPAAQLTLSAHDDSAPYAQTATRPLCAYPAYPHLTGSDSTDASSFECRMPAGAQP